MTEQRTEWLTWRRTGIGASDVAAVLGLSPWTSPWALWADKVGLSTDDDPSEDMEFGTRAEPMLRDYFQDRTGLTVAGEQMRVTHPEHAWMLATLDGLAFDGNAEPTIANALGGVEHKKSSDMPEAWAERIPLHYQCQAQWQMACTGLERCWFSVLHTAFGRMRYRVYEFARDDADIAHLIDRCSTFWHDHVLTGVPPLADGSASTTDAIKHAYPAGIGSIEADDDLAAMVDELARAKSSLKAQETRISSIENELKARMADEADEITSGLTPKGEPKVIASWREQESTRLDTKAVRAAHGDKFDTHSTTRVLRIHLKPSTPTPPTKAS